MAAEGSRDELAYKEKATAGGVASGTYKKVRRVSDTLDATPTVTQSNEIVDTREVADQLRTGLNVGGTINAEMPPGAHDDLIAAVLQSDNLGSLGSMALPSETTITQVSASISAGVLTVSSTTGLAVGDWVLISGATPSGTSDENNGWKRVSALTSTTIETVPALQDGSDDLTIRGGQTITNGETLRVFDFEKLRDGAAAGGGDLYEAYLDAYINGFSLSASPGSIMTSSFDILALRHTLPNAALGTTPYNVAGGTNRAANTINDVDVRLAGSAVTTGATQFSLNATNNLAGRTALGVLGFASIRNGTYTVTGSTSLYLESDTERQRMLDDDKTDIAFIIDADDGKQVHSFPAISYSSANRGSPGNNQDVIQVLNFQAFKGAAATPYTHKVQFFPNP